MSLWTKKGFKFLTWFLKALSKVGTKMNLKEIEIYLNLWMVVLNYSRKTKVYYDYE